MNTVIIKSLNKGPVLTKPYKFRLAVFASYNPRSPEGLSSEAGHHLSHRARGAAHTSLGLDELPGTESPSPRSQVPRDSPPIPCARAPTLRPSVTFVSCWVLSSKTKIMLNRNDKTRFCSVLSNLILYLVRKELFSHFTHHESHYNLTIYGRIKPGPKSSDSPGLLVSEGRLP